MTPVVEMTWAGDEARESLGGSRAAEVIILIYLSVLVSAIWPVNLQDESHSGGYAEMVLLSLRLGRPGSDRFLLCPAVEVATVQPRWWVCGQGRRGLVRRVGVAVSGSSGQGWRGYRPRRVARTAG